MSAITYEDLSDFLDRPAPLSLSYPSAAETFAQESQHWDRLLSSHSSLLAHTRHGLGQLLIVLCP
jgi:hypothetical protein